MYYSFEVYKWLFLSFCCILPKCSRLMACTCRLVFVLLIFQRFWIFCSTIFCSAIMWDWSKKTWTFFVNLRYFKSCCGNADEFLGTYPKFQFCQFLKNEKSFLVHFPKNSTFKKTGGNDLLNIVKLLIKLCVYWSTCTCQKLIF